MKFSICIPNYNYSRYLKETIESILSQGYDDLEIIIADNKSTDDSVEMLKAFNDPRIIIRENRYNVGFAPNLDKATQGATGDYMILVSSDDRMLPGTLKWYAAVIKKYEEEGRDLVISSSTDLIDSEGQNIGFRNGINDFLAQSVRGVAASLLKEEEVFDGLELAKPTLDGNFIAIGRFVSTCYSRKLFEQVEGYRSVMSVIPDAHFSHKLMLQNPKVIFLKKSGFEYRLHSQNNYAQIHSNIKMLSDKYQLTYLYSNEELETVGLTREKVQASYIQTWCLKKPFIRFFGGRFSMVYRPVFFGLAAFPSLMLSSWRLWAILLFLPYYPLFRLRRGVLELLGLKKK